MTRLHKTLLLLSVLAIAPAAAYPLFGSANAPCYAAGGASYRLSSAAAPDFRVRIDNAAARPDLRMQIVDRPEIADFVMADDSDARAGDDCKAGAKTIHVDASETSPDVTIALSLDAAAPDYKIYVHSARLSHEQAAALLAATWKASQKHDLADRR